MELDEGKGEGFIHNDRLTSTTMLDWVTLAGIFFSLSEAMRETLKWLGSEDLRILDDENGCEELWKWTWEKENGSYVMTGLRALG